MLIWNPVNSLVQMLKEDFVVANKTTSQFMQWVINYSVNNCNNKLLIITLWVLSLNVNINLKINLTLHFHFFFTTDTIRGVTLPFACVYNLTDCPDCRPGLKGLNCEIIGQSTNLMADKWRFIIFVFLYFPIQIQIYSLNTFSFYWLILFGFQAI